MAGIVVISTLYTSKLNKTNLKRALIIGRGSSYSETLNSKRNPQSTIDHTSAYLTDSIEITATFILLAFGESVREDYEKLSQFSL